MRKVLFVLLIVVLLNSAASASSGRRAKKVKVNLAATIQDTNQLIKINHKGRVKDIKLDLNVVHEVRVSPNGKMIAVTGYQNEPVWKGGVFVKKLSGGNWKQLTTNSSDYSISWASNSEIVYINEFAGPMKVNVKTGVSTRFRTETTNPVFLAADPVTGRLAVIEDHVIDSTVFSRIAILDADGTALVRMDWLQDAGIWGLEWSPDGTELMFGREWVDEETMWHFGLWVSDCDGYGELVEEEIRQATWLPDGGIAYTFLEYYPSSEGYRTSIVIVPECVPPFIFQVEGIVDYFDAY